MIPIFIPPLRERKTDIPLLANHFMQEAAMKHGQSPFRIAKEALTLLLDYAWPGNVRELQNAIQFAFVKSNGRLLAVDDLPMEIKGQLEHLPRKGPVRKLEARTVKAALKKAGGNKSRAARLLGVGRATLYRFLNAHPEALPPD